MSTRTTEVESYPAGFEVKPKLAVPTGLPFCLTEKLADYAHTPRGAASRTKATSPGSGIRIRARERIFLII